MMKKIWFLIITIYLIVYIYAAYKNQVDPENSIWGWICALVFGILSIIGISLYSKYGVKSQDEHRGQVSENDKS